MVGPLRGGGVKGKGTFIFFNFDAIYNKNVHLSKYGHITLKFVGK